MGLTFESNYVFQFPTEADSKEFYEQTGEETKTYGSHFNTRVPLLKELNGKTVHLTSNGYGCVDLTEFNRNNVVGVTYQCWSCQNQNIHFIRNILAEDFTYENSDPYEDSLEVETFTTVLWVEDDETIEKTEDDFETEEEFYEWCDTYHQNAVTQFKEMFITYQQNLLNS